MRGRHGRVGQEECAMQTKRTKYLVYTLAIAAVIGPSVELYAQKSKPKAPAAPAPSPSELVLQGKVAAAVAAAQKTPDGANSTLRAVVEKTDAQVTDRKLAEARAALAAAQKF